MSRLIKIVLMSFAIYRVSRMIAKEDGPAYVFEELRARARHNAATKQTPIASSIAEGLECPHCLGIWLALIIPFLPDFVIVPLGLAGMQSALETALN